MMKIFAKLLVLTVFVLFIGVAARAEVDVPWQWVHQQQIDKAVEECRQLLAPFSAEAGFPETLPEGLNGKSWSDIRVKIAQNCSKSAKILLELVDKYKLPVRLRLGAMYFQKRFVLGAQIYPHKTETDRVHEFQCRDFAGACDIGLKEMKLWASAEPIWTGDMLWAKTIREGLDRVKAMLPSFPQKIGEAEARDIWRELASKAVKAGNEAGMISTRVGGFDFPAWRLKFAVKYFKAAAKAAVADSWYAREADPTYWKKACIKLQKAVEPLAGEIDELLSSLPQ